MIRKLIEWAVNNSLVVVLLTAALLAGGGYAFVNVNVEAYPDPAPAIIELVAQFPGASAEEVERQVTIPLEVTLAGMPGLHITRTKSLFGLAHLRNQFHYGIDFEKARQEVINRLQFVQNLPPGVQPQISPQSPTGEIYRYTLSSPKNPLTNEDIYSLSDLKALQDWLLQREFKRVPRILDVSGVGGKVKRYEIHPDPDRLKRFGITLAQLQSAIANSNANVGGDYLRQGSIVQVVRGLGVIGGGRDPMERAFAMNSPAAAAAYLRAEEKRRLREIRDIVITANNNIPILVDHVVDGGPVEADADLGKAGVVVSNQTRLGRISLSRPLDGEGKDWVYLPDVIQGVVLMHRNKESRLAIDDVKVKVEELNKPGRLLPGVQVESYYDRSDLIHVTTETVHENLAWGMGLVVIVLLMFLSNVRCVLIVAINLPLALLFAFGVLFLRGKSANLLSIGAVDFGILVDSSVIIVENIYRHLSSGEYANLPTKERITRASHEVERGLFFSRVITVCAFIPLFTMQGPEGQIFGPMADTYAYAIIGALLLACTISPVLCLALFKHLKPAQDNFLVRWLKRSYLRQLNRCLNHRWVTLGLFLALVLVTALFAVPRLGREFMPELEEGNLWIRANFPTNVALETTCREADRAQAIMRKYAEVRTIVAQVGRPDDGTDPTGFNVVQFFVPLRAAKDWPIPPGQTRPRTKEELVEALSGELQNSLPGVGWNFSQYIRDNVMEALSGVQGDNSVKIFGPDLAQLEWLAEQVKNRLEQVSGIGPGNVDIFRIMGQSNVELRADPQKCRRWGVSVADVNNVIDTAVRGKAFTQMIEGEKLFDISLRWPERRRQDLSSLLDIPVDVANNQIGVGVASRGQTALTGPSTGPATVGVAMPPPAQTGSAGNAPFSALLPRLPLRELVSPVGPDGQPDPSGEFVRPGVSIIYREQGNRLIALKFSVRGRDLASAVAEAQAQTRDLFQAPYRAEWGGEFEEMEVAERRLMWIIPLSLALIFILLYLAFHSLLDAVLVLSNVVALSLGGVWALLLTGTNFSISAAVGFISIFGVAIMDGLLTVAYFNQLRYQGRTLREAIVEGAEKRVRPMMMTSLTAIFGLLPAALSTGIGSQTQKPLAIVVVGGMMTSLLLTRYLMPVLYTLYGNREPSAEAGSMAH
ncbi:MAG TPA: efflux RND transporter permease subunit [Gemmataceae bacterium]|nr:efflux RND transporter permease subunit [Gemmataceae bacterium]